MKEEELSKKIADLQKLIESELAALTNKENRIRSEFERAVISDAASAHLSEKLTKFLTFEKPATLVKIESLQKALERLREDYAKFTAALEGVLPKINPLIDDYNETIASMNSCVKDFLTSLEAHYKRTERIFARLTKTLKDAGLSTSEFLETANLNRLAYHDIQMGVTRLNFTEDAITIFSKLDAPQNK